MNKLGTVIRFTYGIRVKQRSFLITTIIFIAIISVLIHLPSIIASFSADDGPKRVGIVDGSGNGGTGAIVSRLTEFYSSQPEPSLEIVGVQTEEEAKRMVDEGELSAFLLATAESNANGFPSFLYKSKDALPSGIGDLRAGLAAVNQSLASETVGLTPDQTAKLFAPVSITPVQLTDAANEGKSESEIQLAFGLVYVLLILLYIGVLGYGNLVATEITAEKSSRVMELLISSVSPLTQLFGKIIGICLLGLTQIIVFIAAGAVNLFVSQDNPLLSSLDINLADVDPMLVVYFLIFYLLGYLIYATVYAAAGSLVSRTEEVGQVIMPIMMLVVGAFFLAMYGLTNSNSTVVVVMSFVPFFSPLLMFLRIGLSDPALWEIALSIGILLVSIYALGWLAAKIYRAGVLMYGKLPSFKELRKAMKAFDV